MKFDVLEIKHVRMKIMNLINNFRIYLIRTYFHILIFNKPLNKLETLKNVLIFNNEARAVSAGRMCYND